MIPPQPKTILSREQRAELYAITPAETNLAVHVICQATGGCAGEGRILHGRLVGRCQRCGLGLLSD